MTSQRFRSTGSERTWSVGTSKTWLDCPTGVRLEEWLSLLIARSVSPQAKGNMDLVVGSLSRTVRLAYPSNARPASTSESARELGFSVSRAIVLGAW